MNKPSITNVCKHCRRPGYRGSIAWWHSHNESQFCTISPLSERFMPIDSGLIAIRELIDLELANAPSSEVQANLYSARIHIVKAIAAHAQEVSDAVTA